MIKGKAIYRFSFRRYGLKVTIGNKLLYHLILFSCCFICGCVDTTALVQQAIKLADFSNEEKKRDLQKYFDEPFNKVYWIDPFDKTDYYRWWGYDFLADAKKKGLSRRWLVLFAENNKIVYQTKLSEYLQSALGKGRSYFERGEYEKAAREFERDATSNQDDWYVFSRLGWTYMYLNKYTESERNFRKSIALRGKDSTWLNIGLIESIYFQGRYNIVSNLIDQLPQELSQNQAVTINLIQASIQAIQGEDKENQLTNKFYIGLNARKTDKGLLANQIYKNLPADLAGIETGDIIVKAMGYSLLGKNPGDLKQLLEEKSQLGELVPVSVLRKEKTYKGMLHVGITDKLLANKIARSELKLFSDNVQQDFVNTVSTPTETESTVKPKPVNTSHVSSDAMTKPLARWGVVIGIAKYKYSGDNGIPNLLFADDDARAFAQSLQTLGWNESHIKLLTNEDATRRNIMIALKSWLTKAGTHDQIVLFWAGHGFPDPEDPEKVYLATYDTEIVIPATGYRMDEVRRAIEEIGSKNVILFADTCHAGKLITRGKGSRGISILPNIRGKNIPKGWVFMVGADTDRQAIEHTSWKNGAFTHSLIKGLNGEADGFQSAGVKDGIVTLGELKDYLRTSMPAETQRVLGVAKHPVITTNTGDPDIWNLTLQVSR